MLKMFGKRKAEFPMVRHNVESELPDDMLDCCGVAYGKLIRSGIERTKLPMPIRHVFEAARFVTWVINGGNGFNKYFDEEGWRVERVNTSLAGLDALGLAEMAGHLRPFADRISAAIDDPAQRAAAIAGAWRDFDGEHLAAVEQWWIFDADFYGRAKTYLVETMTFDIVEGEDFDEAIARYRAGL